MTDVVSRLYNDPHMTNRRRGPAASRQMLPAMVEQFFTDGDSRADERSGLVVWSLGAPALGITGWLLFGSWVGLGLFGVVVGLALVAASQIGPRQNRRVVDALPEFVDDIARTLRSGGSLAMALREAAGTGSARLGVEIQRVVDQLDGGRSAAEALGEWAAAAPQSEVRIVASALAIASENEAGATRALDGVSQSLRDRQAIDAEIRALTAHASASLQALAFLPIAFLGVDAMFDGRGLAYLTHHPFGRLCLGLGLGLELVGWWWMRTMIRSRLPR